MVGDSNTALAILFGLDQKLTLEFAIDGVLPTTEGLIRVFTNVGVSICVLCTTGGTVLITDWFTGSPEVWFDCDWSLIPTEG